ncbi:mesaconyl-C4 CoA hydratase [Paenarthrobacter nicotinovorans]|uniref:mesaconyl-C4 CoA hydratase n=1 Tax=Paenarthrobacter nicotinovorans TaxID=29320 RepID=UPI0004ADAF8B|nr:mesaconyl-C4 CoA hydratase [Paenarthrobacter nicotinovorans]
MRPTTLTERAVRTEVIASEPVEALAAALDIEVPFTQGTSVPPLWHWLYLLERNRHNELGPDGHPTVGIPAPPGPGRRRMFAGGRVSTFGHLTVGTPATKVISIAGSVEKTGRTGPLTFTTVRHEIFQNNQLVIREEQDIVYRAPGKGSLPAPPSPPAPPAGPVLSQAADERLLFRFSALTYNAHRIHYDLDWCLNEGYDGLVIHGPLLALMMGEHMRREGIGLLGKTFSYRLASPMTKPQTFSIVPGPDGLEKGAEARSADDAICAISTLSEV